MKKENFIELDIIEKFPSQYPDISFLGYVSNLVNLEKFIAVAGILSPPLVEDNGRVFLKENYSIIQTENIYEKFKDNPCDIERYVNMVSLWDFYALAYDESTEDEDLFLTFVNLIKNFWQMYLNYQYPEKKFVVELSETGMFYETGYCITFYQL